MADEGEQERGISPGIDRSTMDESLPQTEDVKQTYKSFKYVTIYATAVRGLNPRPGIPPLQRAQKGG